VSRALWSHDSDDQDTTKVIFRPCCHIRSTARPPRPAPLAGLCPVVGSRPSPSRAASRDGDDTRPAGPGSSSFTCRCAVPLARHCHCPCYLLLPQHVVLFDLPLGLPVTHTGDDDGSNGTSRFRGQQRGASKLNVKSY
jgi:hypothetical protein